MCAFVVDDQNLDQPGVEHFHHVFVLHGIGDEDQLDLWLAIALEALVLLLQALVVARCLAHMHCSSGQVVERLEHRRLRSGDDDLVDRLAAFVARYEVDFLLAFFGDCQIADCDIGRPSER